MICFDCVMMFVVGHVCNLHKSTDHSLSYFFQPDQSVMHPSFNQLCLLSHSWVVIQSVQSVGRSVSQPANQSITESFNRPITTNAVSHAFVQAVIQLVGQSSSQSGIHSVCLSVDQSDWSVI